MQVNERGFAQFLIENGADLNCIDDAGNTALHIATNCNNIEIVQILLDKGAKTDLKNVNNMTALDIAKIYNRVEIFKLLSN